MKDRYNHLLSKITEESCVIVGLFHDIGKVGMPGKPYYLPEIKDGKPTGAYTINPEIVAMGLSLRSLYLVSYYSQVIDERNIMYFEFRIILLSMDFAFSLSGAVFIMPSSIRTPSDILSG